MTSLPPYIAPSWTSSHKAIGGSDSEDDDARKLRRACQIAAEALDFAGSLVKPGITTQEIDDSVLEFLVARGAYPSPLGYMGISAH